VVPLPAASVLRLYLTGSFLFMDGLILGGFVASIHVQRKSIESVEREHEV
jgi:hypothetical protein